MNMENRFRVYHSGFAKIEVPDLHRGRKNADFGQGFYVSRNEEFARRWARYRRGETTYINIYELDLQGLKVLELQRDRTWFSYIFNNRRHRKDRYGEYDIIVGPIANDTIYDTFGIITSGVLTDEEALSLLLLGPAYEQIVLKTDRCLDHLKWIKTEILSPETIERCRTIVAEEEKEYQEAVVEQMKLF